MAATQQVVVVAEVEAAELVMLERMEQPVLAILLVAIQLSRGLRKGIR